MTMKDRLFDDAISDRQAPSKIAPDRGNPHTVEGVRDLEYFLRTPLSGTAAREHGREEEKGDVQDFADCRRERLPPSKLGVVVPTEFEPVFKDDYDFALYFH